MVVKAVAWFPRNWRVRKAILSFFVSVVKCMDGWWLLRCCEELSILSRFRNWDQLVANVPRN